MAVEASAGTSIRPVETTIPPTQDKTPASPVKAPLQFLSTPKEIQALIISFVRFHPAYQSTVAHQI